MRNMLGDEKNLRVIVLLATIEGHLQHIRRCRNIDYTPEEWKHAARALAQDTAELAQILDSDDPRDADRRAN
jgi:hypothetical protein